MSDYTIFKGSEAGSPDLFEADKFYFEPQNWEGGVYSQGYTTEKEAQDAAEAWVVEQDFQPVEG